MENRENKTNRKKNDTVYIYGLNDEYRVVHYFFIPKEVMSMKRVQNTANYLKSAYPSVTSIFAVDNCREIYKAFMQIKENSKIENRADFKMLLEQYGIRIQL